MEFISIIGGVCFLGVMLWHAAQWWYLPFHIKKLVEINEKMLLNLEEMRGIK